VDCRTTASSTCVQLTDALDAGKKIAIKNLGYLEVYLAGAKESTKKAAAKLKA
jgi:hypothetical protein